MVISNAKKQARFRKKEELKKSADKAFRIWQNVGIHSHANPRDVHARLKEAAALPSGWTEEDYNLAERRISQLGMDLTYSPDDLQNDVYEARGQEAFLKTPDPGGFVAEAHKAVSDTHALASHLISALELSGIKNSDKAAAVMEALRHVGRALATSSEVAQSSSNTVCLVSLLPVYDRPDWFLERLSDWLEGRLGKDPARGLGRRLAQFDHESSG